MNNNYNIEMASKLSGVPKLSIRAWEGRYSAINPDRTDSNRRLYSDSDIEKLILLRKLTQNGFRIGNLAQLSIEELKTLYKNSIPANNIIQEYQKYSLSEIHIDVINECIEAVKNYDEKQLGVLLNQASVKFSQPELTEKIIIPLIDKIGDYWKEGIMRVSHEHFTSAVIVKFLNNLSEGYKIESAAPKIIITTPDGQYHEVGALIGSSLANSRGWKTIYLGASLPAEDIASVTKELDAGCIFLSIVYPNDNSKLNAQLKKIRELVGKEVHIIASGNAVPGYENTLKEINAYISYTPNQFGDYLSKIRNKIHQSKVS